MSSSRRESLPTVPLPREEKVAGRLDERRGDSTANCTTSQPPRGLGVDGSFLLAAFFHRDGEGSGVLLTKFSLTLDLKALPGHSHASNAADLRRPALVSPPLMQRFA